MNDYLGEINKIKKQKEKIDKKIKQEVQMIEKIKDLRKDHNFKTKVMIQKLTWHYICTKLQ